MFNVKSNLLNSIDRSILFLIFIVSISQITHSPFIPVSDNQHHTHLSPSVYHPPSSEYAIDVVSLQEPSNYSIEQNNTDNIKFVFEEIDDEHINYTLWRNGTEVKSAINASVPNSSRLNVNHQTSSNLNIGTYNFTIIGTTSFSSVSGTSFATIYPKEAPQIVDKQVDPIFEIGQQSMSVWWMVEDLSPQNYTLLEDNKKIANNTWNSPTTISYNLENQTEGEYNYTLVVQDIFGLTTVSSTNVSIVNSTAPELEKKTHVAQIDEELGNYTLSWTFTDVSPQNYTILKNSTAVANGTWSNNIPINHTIKPLVLGSYNYTIIIQDSLNNTASNTSIVSIVDITPPTITDSPGQSKNVTYQTPFNLEWNAFDRRPDKYWIYQDGVLFTNGSWGNESIITLSTRLDLGVYNFTIKLVDTKNNLQVMTTIVHVLPIETIIPDIKPHTNVFVGDVETIDTYWTTNGETPINGGDVNITLINHNGTIIRHFQKTTDASGGISFVLNYSTIAPGIYSLNVTFEKLGYESQTITTNITVHQITPQYTVNMPNQFIQGENYIIAVKAEYNNSDLFNLYEFSPGSGTINSLLLILQFSYYDSNNNLHRLDLKSITNSTGHAVFVVNSTVTINVEQISNVIVFADSSLKVKNIQYSVGSEVLQNISIKQYTPPPEPPSNLPFYLFISFSVIVVLGILIYYYQTTLYWVFYYLMARKKVRIMKELLGINSIIIRSKAGIPIFQKNYDEQSTDGTLVAGMSAAITSFLDEISVSGESEFEIIQREKIKMITRLGSRSFISFFSTRVFSNELLKRIEKAHLVIDQMEILEKDHVEDSAELHQRFKDILIHSGVRLDYLDPITIDTGRMKELRKNKTLRGPVLESIRDLLSSLREHNINKLRDDNLKSISIDRFLYTKIVRLFDLGILKKNK